MTPDKAARNWKVTAAVATIAVIAMLLLWPKLRQMLGSLTFGDTIIEVPAPGAVDYPDLFLTINYPPSPPQVAGGSTCGCDSHGQDIIDAAMEYFLNGMRDVNTAYNAAVLNSVPAWAVQYWNNSRGYALSQNSGTIFGGG